jgi:two-component system, LytTR family, response regulator
MIKAIIVDDEQPALDKLEKLLKDSGLISVEGTFTEPTEALSFLKKTQVDAVFLDIEMPDTDGIELAIRILDIQERISVVFVTAYNQYAVEAFRLNAIDYLMKPVTSERLEETLGRIIKA